MRQTGRKLPVIRRAALAVTLAASLAAGCSSPEKGNDATGAPRSTTTTTVLGGATLQLCAPHKEASGDWEPTAVPSDFNMEQLAQALDVTATDVQDFGLFGALDCQEGVAVDDMVAGMALVRTEIDGTTGPVDALCAVVGSATDAQVPPAPGTTETAVLGICVPPNDVLQQLKLQEA